MYGEDIIKLQHHLVGYGFNGIGETDGYYGPLTESVIKNIQCFLGFEQDGKINKVLWDYLFNKSNENLLKDISTILNYNISGYTNETEDRMGYSTEGGHIERYFFNRITRKIELTLYGEIMQVHYYLFFINENYYFIIIENHRYRLPETDEKMVGYNGFYDFLYSEENLQRTEIEYKTFIYRDKLFQIINGDFLETEYDLERILNIINNTE
jgi:hypothetical protein